MQPMQNGSLPAQSHQYSVRATAEEVLTPPQMASFIPVIPVSALNALRQEFHQGLAQIEAYRLQQAQQQGERIDSLEYKTGQLQKKVDISFKAAFSRIQVLEEKVTNSSLQIQVLEEKVANFSQQIQILSWDHNSEKGFVRRRLNELVAENRNLRVKLDALGRRAPRPETTRTQAHSSVNNPK